MEDDELDVHDTYQIKKNELCKYEGHNKLKKKNCNSPLCVYSLGEISTGIWGKEKAFLSHLGEDPSIYEHSDKERKPTVKNDGLINLGATCYINSILQSLFMNPLFRKSLYQCKSGINNEIVFELQKLFSSMELGKKVFQDTTSLCKLMNIDINYQQDGCEFWKLLVTTLEEQGVEVPFFKGKQTYVTECEECNRKSPKTENFMGLEIFFSGKSSLQSCVEKYSSTEQMKIETGNGYECPDCGRKTDATRRLLISEAPQYLHLQMMRFEFQHGAQNRVKLKDYITHPQELVLIQEHNGKKESKTYTLYSAIYHKGAGTSVGHYTLDIYKDKYNAFHFDDAVVERLNVIEKSTQPASKKRKKSDKKPEIINVDDDEEEDYATPSKLKGKRKSSSSEDKGKEDGSKDGYMYIYRLKDKNISPMNTEDFIPEEIKREVKEVNDKFDAEKNKFKEKKKNTLQNLKSRKDCYSRLFIKKNPCKTAEEQKKVDCVWLPVMYIKEWVTGLETAKGIDNFDPDVFTPVLPSIENYKCIHGKLCPKKAKEMKYIELDTFKAMIKQFEEEIHNCSYQKIDDDEVRDWISSFRGPNDFSCFECRFEQVEDTKKMFETKQHITKMLELLDASGDKDHFICTRWKKRIEKFSKGDVEKKGNKDQDEDINFQENVNDDIWCHEHQTLRYSRLNTHVTKISAKAFAAIKRLFPNVIEIINHESFSDRGCLKCIERKEEVTKVKSLRQKDLKKFDDLNEISLLKNEDFNYVFPIPKTKALSLSIMTTGKYYVIPTYWMDDWRKYVSMENDTSLPACNLDIAKCDQHKDFVLPVSFQDYIRGLSPLVDEEAKNYCLIHENSFDHLFGGMNGDSFKWEGEKLMVEVDEQHGLREVIAVFNPPLCEICDELEKDKEKERKTDFSDKQIFYKILQSIPDADSKLKEAEAVSSRVGETRRSNRLKNSQPVPLIASSDEQINILKLKIFENSDYSPANQQLYFNDKLITNLSSTLKQSGIKAGDTIGVFIHDTNAKGNVDIAEYFDEIDATPERGFSGTKLSGKKI